MRSDSTRTLHNNGHLLFILKKTDICLTCHLLHAECSGSASNAPPSVNKPHTVDTEKERVWPVDGQLVSGFNGENPGNPAELVHWSRRLTPEIQALASTLKERKDKGPVERIPPPIHSYRQRSKPCSRNAIGKNGGPSRT